jgi:UDP-N-acetyl-D-mannosaminuronate dehydrogenase|tara:strand:- start:135 stop:890 length:756 start_codon:yes stop_codon:yes gene_type:complete
MEKDLVIGLGEIGLPIFKLFSKNTIIEGIDKNPKLSKIKPSLENHKISIMHICIPFNKLFISEVRKLEKKFKPRLIVIHSTISPHTTEKLQNKLEIPIIYSATRGVHKRMLRDLKRYVKFYSIYENAPNSKWASKIFENKLKKCNVKYQKMSTPLTLELAKIICDTSYYGWLINYAQISKIITEKENVDYDEMWKFSDEIHKILKNRPKMFPGFIGGHCVIPNLELIDDDSLNQISTINKIFKKFIDSKSI